MDTDTLRTRIEQISSAVATGISGLSAARPALASVTPASWAALGAGAALLLIGASRRSTFGVCLAASSAPLFYRGITGRWPSVNLDGARKLVEAVPAFMQGTPTLVKGRALQARESIRLDRPVTEVYRAWRRLDSVPRLTTHLGDVAELSDGHSRWLAAIPGGLTTTGRVEIVDEVANQSLTWRSRPGSDVATVGYVTFEEIEEGRSTQVTVHVQHSPATGGRATGIASVSGHDPARTLRDDLRSFKQMLESPELPLDAASATA